MGIFSSIFGGKSQSQSASAYHPNLVADVSLDSISTILSGIDDAIILTDANKKVMLVNKGAESLIGVPAKQMIGQVLDNVLKFYSKDADITSSIWTPQNLGDIKMVTVGKTASKDIFVNIKVSNFTQCLGCSWMISMHDISVEKGIESMRMGFVSVAAHELRTPITSIKGYLDVFMSDYKDKLNEDQKGLLAHMEDNTDRLAMLVENLLDVSRVERGSMSLNPKGVDWEALVTEIVGDMHERAAEKNIQLEFVKPATKLPLLKVDKVRMAEVLSNLIGNAINYTNPNGKVTVTTEQKDNEVVTNVSDTGVGIPADAIPHLFTKFFRVTQGLTQQAASQGNGLGLYISKSIVDMHKGKIWVTSEVGKGSVFSFSIPVA